jgi:hypothetical protein
LPLGDGRKTVAAAGTPEALTAISTTCESVIITALSTNTKPVVVGGPDVLAKAAERSGTALAAGGTVKLTSCHDQVDDLSKVFIDAEVSGEGVSYSYGHRP